MTMRNIKQRTYSDKEKAEALAVLDSCDGDTVSLRCKKAVELTGIPFSSLYRWANSKNINSDVSELKDIKKLELSDKFEQIANKAAGLIFEKLSTESLKKFSIPHLSNAAGVSTEKMLLLRGQPTLITKNLNESERAAKATELLARAKLRLAS